MDKYAKEVYDFVLSQPYHSFIYQMYPEKIPGGIDRLPEFKLACRYLSDKGYAEIKKPGSVSLTHAGIHKREIERIELRRRFLTHFLPGFISGVFVAAIGEVLGMYILSLLGIV